MPVPEGVITTSEINKPEENQDDLSGVQDSSDAELSDGAEEGDETTQEV